MNNINIPHLWWVSLRVCVHGWVCQRKRLSKWYQYSCEPLVSHLSSVCCVTLCVCVSVPPWFYIDISQRDTVCVCFGMGPLCCSFVLQSKKQERNNAWYEKELRETNTTQPLLVSMCVLLFVYALTRQHDLICPWGLGALWANRVCWQRIVANSCR